MTSEIQIITSTSFNTESGNMTACSAGEAICLLEFSIRKSLASEFSYLEKYFNTKIREGMNSQLEMLKQQISEYFEGTRREFSIPLVSPGTVFQKQVWQELLKIPYGTTRSYIELATILGNPGAVRAVAAANRMNRIAIIIPCHRVIGSDGNLIGYSGGLERKRWLLEHEKRHSGQPSDLTLF
jgi:AraC family transcriptional regulator, regulatory protein of adaptative response / methylated-DNA-[protein]-cysteine methyltransferase